jgi:hypothetical protein
VPYSKCKKHEIITFSYPLSKGRLAEQMEPASGECMICNKHSNPVFKTECE